MTHQPGEGWATPAASTSDGQTTTPLPQTQPPVLPPPPSLFQPAWSAPEQNPTLPLPQDAATVALPQDAAAAALPQDGTVPPPLPIPPAQLPPPPGYSSSAPFPADQPATSASRRGMGAMLAMATSAALVAGLLGGISGYWLMDRGDADREVTSGALPAGSAPSSASMPSATLPPITRSAGSVAEIAARVLPSVVQIEVKGADGEGTGSGFVIDDKGHILTNNHVVSATENPTITVVFDDGTQKPATLVGKDVSYDLAVLKADVGSRPPLVLGNSEQVVVGDLVIAIGAPLGLQGTVTTGIVSAKNRPVSAGDGTGNDSYMNAIQTDAAINPGNSGGPLVDARGQVIGVNSAIARSPGANGTSSSGNIGLGFAIPSNQAKRTAELLITKGVAEHPVIGVQLDERYAGEGVKVTEEAVSGEPVTPDGPADKAGIEPGDIIVAIDGRPVITPVELVVAVRSRAVGDVVKLTVRRGGKELTLTVKLAAAPSS